MSITVEIIKIGDDEISLKYVSKEEIYPLFGYAKGKTAVVRKDLPLSVKNFVKTHELYHCIDKKTWGGWIGQELRANLFAAVKEPLGFFVTTFLTLTSKDRLKLYIERFRKKGRSRTLDELN